MTPNSDEVVEFTLDRPRKLLYDYPAQMELERQTGLGLLELTSKLLGAVSPRLLTAALWVGMKHAGEKLPPLKDMDPVMEKARLAEYEYVEGGEAKKGRVNNGYLASQVVKALNLAGALGEPNDDFKPTANGGDPDADPTRAPSQNT